MLQDQPGFGSRNLKSGCVRLRPSAPRCKGILPPRLTVGPYAASRLTLCRLHSGLNAHLTHSLPLWCNPVEVISFTGAFNFSQYIGGGGGVDGSSVCV